MTHFFSHIPPWVLPLLLALIWLGVKRRMPRRISVMRAVVFPVFLSAMTLFRLSGDANGLLEVLCWAAAVAASAWLAQATSYARSWQLAADGWHIEAAGSWWPLGLILAIFSTRFISAVLLATQPALHEPMWFNALCAGLYGAFSGVLLAPVLRLLRSQLSPRIMLV